MRNELSQFFTAEAEGNDELKRAETRLAKLDRMEKNLQRLFVEEEISHKDFREYRSQIEAERSRLRNTVDIIRQSQYLVIADFEIALELATQLDFLFEHGNFDQRRLLCETVLKRLYVEGGRITGKEFNAPFAIIARANGSGAVTSGGEGGTRTPTRVIDLIRLLPQLLDQLISLGEIASQISNTLGVNGHRPEEVAKLIRQLRQRR